MSGKSICLFPSIIVLVLVCHSQAVTRTWNDNGPDSLWGTAENWSGGTLPTLKDMAKLDRLPGPTVVGEAAQADNIPVGTGASTGALTIEGGTLTTARWLIVGYGPGSNGTINMESGTINVGTHLYVGFDGAGTLNISGGKITVTDLLEIPKREAGTGHVNLHGGTISTRIFLMRSTGSVGTMDITAGKLIVNGDVREAVQGYIDNGWVTAYSEYPRPGRVEMTYDVETNKTTLRGIHPFEPNPATESTVSARVDQLSWTLPNPSLPGGIVDCDVYFGIDPAVENNPKIVSRQAVQSVAVTLAPLTKYYWAIDVYDSNISATQPVFLSPVFTFDTNNQPPDANAGADIETWIEGDQKVVQLVGIVSDDEPTTLVWTVIAEPNEANPAQISDTQAANPTVTLKERGSYTLQLEASDGEFTDTDTVQIVLYADSCEHARNQPDFVRLPGDTNDDCVVDFLDLANLGMSWLEANHTIE
ncbi:MAG: hypothetical protein ACYSWO_02610 [Planctomycetota bacterium]|jgi:hypothetical protein